MSIRNLINTSALAMVLGLGASLMNPSNARAQGFVGGIIGGDVGRFLDGANHQLGRPFEQGVAAAMDYYAPGSGRYFLEGQRAQDNNWYMPRQSGGSGPARGEGALASSGSEGLSGGDGWTCRQGNVSMICSRQ